LAGIVLAGILVLALNVLAGNTLRTARLDLTQDSLFTFSDGSLRILQSLEEPITLRFYFSETLANGVPQIKRYGQRVKEMVEEYAAVAEGKIRLEVIDPVPFTDAEDDAVRNGLQALPVSASDNLYFGLVGTNTVDDREVVKYFAQEKEQFLEYELTRLVYNLSNPKRPVVGLLTSHLMNADVPPMLTVAGQGPQQWAIVPQIRETLELKTVYPRDEKIPDDIDILLIVHPGKLTDRMLYAIDQFVLGGGRAIVAVDPFSEVALAFRRQPQGAGIQDSSELEKLLNAWGATVAADKFAGDWRLARNVNVGIPGKVKIMRYLAWMAMGPDNYNLEDVAMSGLGPINMASPGHIAKRDGATTTLTPLLTTSAESMLFDVALIRLGPNPQNLLDNFKPNEQRFVVAARLSGPTASAFPDGVPKPVEEKKEAESKTEAEKADGEKSGDDKAGKDAAAPEAKPHLAKSAKDINVIVLADSDFLFDQFWVRQQNFFGEQVFVATAANADLVINALDHLAGSADLVGLRSRGKSERRFQVMSELRLEAEKKYLEREKQLADKLKETKKRLNDLQGKASAGGGALLSSQQEAEIDKARAEIRKTRRALRDVQHDLNKDIDRLETRIKFANIGLVPVLIGLLALVLAVVRQRRRQALARRPQA
jgi:ABC-type uncharacterized transport system involved in gliding motility auxiliary subunit